MYSSQNMLFLAVHNQLQMAQHNIWNMAANNSWNHQSKWYFFVTYA